MFFSFSTILKEIQALGHGTDTRSIGYLPSSFIQHWAPLLSFPTHQDKIAAAGCGGERRLRGQKPHVWTLSSVIPSVRKSASLHKGRDKRMDVPLTVSGIWGKESLPQYIWWSKIPCHMALGQLLRESQDFPKIDRMLHLQPRSATKSQETPPITSFLWPHVCNLALGGGNTERYKPP